ncbi:YdcF family protein [Altererythrobacter sp. MF3-039]|uniref:YdcF family protein n=1 Tax=Altererythrobacter sp. MF3-039 TaxID=3252901 RepID=UPI00390C78F9
MIGRVLAALVLVWAFGFLWFAGALPQPVGEVETDAVVVPTGGAGRIDRGLEVLRDKQAPQMLVTGVDPEVTPDEFAAEFNVPTRLMRCCVTLGYAAVDTRGNAAETTLWVVDQEVSRLRLVTTDWHMRRAAAELEASLPPSVTVVRDAVPSEPTFGALFLEYNKLLASVAARLWPV